jgi:hypothetical protein
LWTSFLIVFVILHAFSRPNSTLWYYRLSENGTSCLSAWYTISLKFLKKILRFCFSVLYIIIRCSFSFL